MPVVIYAGDRHVGFVAATVLRSELGVSKRTRCGKRRMAVSLTEGARR
jgi:hypothetical protein